LESDVQTNSVLASEVIGSDVLVDVGTDLFSDNVEISQVFLAICVGFWEPDSGFDFIRNERQLLSSVVLDSSWDWNVVVMVKIVSSMGEHSEKRVNKRSALTGCGLSRHGSKLQFV
jgi:hypothetical protein